MSTINCSVGIEDSVVDRILDDRRNLGLEINDRRDCDAEEVLKRLGIKYWYQLLDLNEIDVEESKKNRGRINTAHDTDVSQSYADSMLNGDRFPAICVRMGRKPVIAGGWHRFNAKLQVGCETILALCFESDDMLFCAACAALNSIIGDPTSTKERIAQAAKLVTQFSWSIRDAASQLRVSRESVGAFIKRDELEQQLADIGVRGFEKLSDTKMKAIGGLKTCPPVMKEVARLALANDSKQTGPELHDYAKAILEIPKEEERLRKVSSDLALCKIGAPKAAMRPKLATFRRLTSHLEALTKDCRSASQLQIDKSDVPELKKRWTLLSKKISTILGG